jgi:hypothetical protein
MILYTCLKPQKVRSMAKAWQWLVSHFERLLGELHWHGAIFTLIDGHSPYPPQRGRRKSTNMRR